MTYDEAAEATRLHCDKGVTLRALGDIYHMSATGIFKNINAYKRGDTEYFVSRKLNVFNLGSVIHTMTVNEITELYNATYGTDLGRNVIRGILNTNDIPHKKLPKGGQRIHPVKERTSYGSIVKEVSEALTTGMTMRELTDKVPYTLLQVAGALATMKSSDKYDLTTYRFQGKRYYKLFNI